MAGLIARRALIAAAWSLAILTSGCAAWGGHSPSSPPHAWRQASAPAAVAPAPPPPAPTEVGARFASVPSRPEDFACTDGSWVRVTYSEARDAVAVSLNGAAPVAMQRVDEPGLTTYRALRLAFDRSGPRVALTGEATEATVQGGDTLGGIAHRVYGDRARAMEIARANGIANPDLIFPGQVLQLPSVERRCRRTGRDPVSYAGGPATLMERRSFSPPSSRQSELRRVRATATDPPLH